MVRAAIVAVGAVLLILNVAIATTQAVEEGEVDVVGINSLAVGSERIVDLVVVVTWRVSFGGVDGVMGCTYHDGGGCSRSSRGPFGSCRLRRGGR